jgi:hypothetical protein
MFNHINWNQVSWVHRSSLSQRSDGSPWQTSYHKKRASHTINMIYLASTTGTTFHRPLSLPGQPTPHLFALDNARFDFNSGCTETRYRECLAFTRHSLYLVNASFTMQLVIWPADCNYRSSPSDMCYPKGVPLTFWPSATDKKSKSWKVQEVQCSGAALTTSLQRIKTHAPLNIVQLQRLTKYLGSSHIYA